MEEKPLKAKAKSLSPQDLGKVRSSDIRNLWTRETLSQPKLNVQITNVYEELDQEEVSRPPGRSGQWYKEKSDAESIWEEWEPRDSEGGSSQEELRGRSLELEQRGDEEGDEDVESQMELSYSVSSLNILKHTHHRAYWVEQQNRLPLPLMELMENEVLVILSKALRSYRSLIGRDHFLTKQLQRYIEGLKKQRTKRQHVSAH